MKWPAKRSFSGPTAKWDPFEEIQKNAGASEPAV